MAAMTENPRAEDLGNIICLEHVNLRVPDQGPATLFYIVGLGLTRDPYMVVGVDNMWVNVGAQQFHLPIGDPQVIPGHIALVLPDLPALAQRLEEVAPRLKGTKFGWRRERDHLAVTCPWGNQFRCYAAGRRFGGMRLGMPYVEFAVAPGAAPGIGRFYRQVMGAPARVRSAGGRAAAVVETGNQQALIFREAAAAPSYDGHHVAIYVANYSTPYGDLTKRGLIMEASRRHQFRFKELVDPASGRPVHTLEHEVRSLRHPGYHRPLVNRAEGGGGTFALR